MSEAKPKAAFVTFYSFKGGVGRSMALINTAGILAGRGFRVLVLDLDLEAPGLSYLDPNAPDISPEQQQPRVRPLQLGFVDLLSDAKERGEAADLFILSANEIAERYTQPYHLPEELREFKDGSLHIMPAGKFDSDYAQRFDALNLRELYQEGLGEPLIRVFKQKLVEADLYDYVLVDSRTGFSDEAGICTRDLADYLMILSGLNRQNIEGTCEFLKTLRVATAGEKRFQIILSPVPNGEDALLDQREAMAKASFEAAWGAKVDLSLQIPYHPQLALTEEPHIFRRRRGYLFEAYRAIERSMLEALGHNARMLLRRIKDTLRSKDYAAALRDLRRMVRLEGGRSVLCELVFDLGMDDWQFLRGKAVGELSQEQITLNNILGDAVGWRVIEFIVDHLPLGEKEWGTSALLQLLEGSSPELANRFYKRMVSATPHDACILSDYAIFLADQHGDLDGAESYYRRALEADPKHANNLGNYAGFLARKRGDLDEAEAYFKRALEANPKHANTLGNYAIFLERKRGDLDEAEAYFKRALEANPKHANHLSNYGQFLVGVARLSEGEQLLVSAFEYSDQYDRSNVGNIAEICYSLWLVSRMQERSTERWEGYFKFFIQKGFKRYPWSFERMLDQAKKILSPEEFEYAEALAHAFLDESQVSNLDHYERWRTLEPLDPMEASNRYSERTSTSISSASS
ncbi:MAG: tetratricopeptide repeat protein [Candidatus Competibacter sp.]|nr:tetratricopeptide repeat protein [Candidatus Competibacter sp.]MDG4585570.1 tetratricopeptide repeat protein [Candidatus Competibacter sp.]